MGSMRQLGIFLWVWLLGISLAQPKATSVLLPSAAKWLTHDGNTVYALLETGEVWVVQSGQAKRLASDWSSDAPIVFAFGRLHGIGQDHELRVVSRGQTSSSQNGVNPKSETT
jgi:hypothetical protein